MWINVYFMLLLHLLALYGLCLIPRENPLTFFWCWFLYCIGALGITCGCHRLWAHRSYKATWPLRLVLMLFATVAAQNDIYEWVRDHRVHHKYFETDAQRKERVLLFTCWMVTHEKTPRCYKQRKVFGCEQFAGGQNCCYSQKVRTINFTPVV